MDKRRVWLLPLWAVLWNQTVYYGGNALARDMPHRSLELWVDPLIPVLPWTVSIYLGCFLFWAAIYVLLAREKPETSCRFYLADFLAKGVCLIFFLLLPTTNLRPALSGDGIWERLLLLVYRVDAPTNLFPSIHCLVSWLCFLGVRGIKGLPRWGVWFTGLTAVCICLSTLTTRQHVAVDVAGGILLAQAAYWAAGRQTLLKPFFRLTQLTASSPPLPHDKNRRNGT